jgi:hypothetical protein
MPFRRYRRQCLISSATCKFLHIGAADCPREFHCLSIDNVPRQCLRLVMPFVFYRNISTQFPAVRLTFFTDVIRVFPTFLTHVTFVLLIKPTITRPLRLMVHFLLRYTTVSTEHVVWEEQEMQILTLSPELGDELPLCIN